jgi:hypothetical protein
MFTDFVPGLPVLAAFSFAVLLLAITPGSGHDACG